MIGTIVIFCGIPACGKSTATKELVRRLDDLDVDYKLLVSDEISSKVYEKVFRFLEGNIKETECLVVDATFYKKKWRDKVGRIAEENDEELLTVYLHCTLETALSRNNKRMERERVTEKAIHVINDEMERPKNPNLKFDTDRADPKKVSERILEELPAAESGK